MSELAGAGGRYILQLFVTGTTSRSARAIENLRRICRTELKDMYELQIIDVYENPDATHDMQVIATPTLIKILPEPLVRIIGDLSSRESVLVGLGVTPLGGGGG